MTDPDPLAVFAMRVLDAVRDQGDVNHADVLDWALELGLFLKGVYPLRDGPALAAIRERMKP